MVDTTDYGPLKALIGTWTGDSGVDVAPEPVGEENNAYYETIIFSPGEDTDNAETQELAIVRYHQQVRRKSNNEVFHDQVGYWLWDTKAEQIVHTFTIPRGVSVIAGGSVVSTKDGLEFSVSAAKDDPDWGIIEAPFMRDNASSQSFKMILTVSGRSLKYEQTTVLNIYDRTFDHTDTNSLKRVD